MVTVDYKFYSQVYGGTATRAAFESALPAAEQHVAWLCDHRCPGPDNRMAYKRAICAAAEVFAEYGQGQVGGFAIGDFRMTGYEGRGTATGDALATQAALRELSATPLAFAGAR